MAVSSSGQGQRLRNFLLALAAIALGLSIYLGFASSNQPTSLAYQAEHSTPWDVAQANGQPTFLEFYANWCGSCQAMATDMAQLKQAYGDRLNFVMLNVDNSKWLPEIIRFGVDGIPHFVFLDQSGSEVGMAIGKQPVSVMEKNLNALLQGQPLPYVQQSGQTSAFTAPLRANSDDPRSHGG
ncbi:thioredoxin family protein [Candidatus Synechococcus calcipolaris G9]|uniref:Thioredoxin family protein n=1 Tax=Candidatus Synechococcus calcipolaris G9 TaxID=1497997 RepID=A0ABT6F0Q0_9SYNE|nr:thioredoxin family protein [Candidatus Synechococcus calcipolaris]MDG2991434.1 thioredoxin family protein [Candidatus Synechococcus calcipolaris G9]